MKNQSKTFGLFGALSHETLSTMTTEQIRQYIIDRVTKAVNTRITAKDGTEVWKYLEQPYRQYTVNVRYTTIDSHLNITGYVVATFTARRKCTSTEAETELIAFEYERR